MKRIICHIIFCLFINLIQGQDTPSILLEDMDEHSLKIKCYCKPGVRNKTRSKGLEISYQYLGAGEISAPNNEFNSPNPTYSKFRKFKTKLSLPLLNKDQLKLIIGFAYNAEQFELETLQNDYQGLIKTTDDLNFKSTAFNLNFGYSPNSTNYIGGRFKLEYNGGYENIVDFSKRYAIYSGGIAYGIKKHEDHEWGFGIAASKNFRRQGFRVLPFIFWNKTFNDNWGFQITFPASYNLRYNMDPKTIFVASATFNGESYSFDQGNNSDRMIAYNHSEIQTILKMERQLIPWLWLDLQAGYNFNYSSSFELQLTRETLLEIDPGDRLLLKVGIFISPPDDFLK